MPTPKFFHLPLDKQKQILQAAHQEFSRVLLADASINKMIQSIGLARGSFYLYFENKEDLYFYLLSDYKEKMIHKMIESLTQTKGDLIMSFHLFFDEIIAFCSTEENKSFFHNVFANMNYRTETYLLSRHDVNEKQNKFEKMVQLIDQSELKDSQLLKEYLSILMIVTMHAIMETFLFEQDIETVRQKYHRQLSILKQGIYQPD